MNRYGRDVYEVVHIYIYKEESMRGCPMRCGAVSCDQLRFGKYLKLVGHLHDMTCSG